MTPATEQAYRKLAEHFYNTRLGDHPPTPKRLADALKECAGEYRPAYFRRLRNAIEFDQHDKGFGDAAIRVAGVKNPITAAGSTAEVKPKRAAVKRVTDADETQLFKHLIQNKDKDTYYAVRLIGATGARPAELKNMVIDGDRVTIFGAKKSHDGKRGADRVIVLSPGQAKVIANAIAHMQTADLGKVKDRLRAAGKALWPQRKALPSMYSWRHQMGSDLKASGLSRVEVAYVMGHQSTESVDRYGNAKTARKGAVCPRADKEADMSHVRIDHKAPPGEPVRAAVSVAEKTEGLQRGSFGSAVKRAIGGLSNDSVAPR
jgi:integrase